MFFVAFTATAFAFMKPADYVRVYFRIRAAVTLLFAFITNDEFPYINWWVAAILAAGAVARGHMRLSLVLGIASIFLALADIFQLGTACVIAQVFIFCLDFGLLAFCLGVAVHGAVLIREVRSGQLIEGDLSALAVRDTSPFPIVRLACSLHNWWRPSASRNPSPEQTLTHSGNAGALVTGAVDMPSFARSRKRFEHEVAIRCVRESSVPWTVLISLSAGAMWLLA